MANKELNKIYVDPDKFNLTIKKKKLTYRKIGRTLNRGARTLSRWVHESGIPVEYAKTMAVVFDIDFNDMIQNGEKAMHINDVSAADAALGAAQSIRRQIDDINADIEKIKEIVNENYLTINYIDKKLDMIIHELNLDYLFFQEKELSSEENPAEDPEVINE